MKIDLKRINDAVHFEASAASSTVKVQIDGSPAMGGQDRCSPYGAGSDGLASCSSLDMVTILQKQRQNIEDFSDHRRRSVRTDNIPQVFTSIHLTV